MASLVERYTDRITGVASCFETFRKSRTYRMPCCVGLLGFVNLKLLGAGQLLETQAKQTR
jgi:hypothetical protein